MSGDIGFGFFIGVFVGAMTLMASLQNCGHLATPDRRCTTWCESAKEPHDGGKLSFNAHGYECRCANLEPVKP